MNVDIVFLKNNRESKVNKSKFGPTSMLLWKSIDGDALMNTCT